MYGAVLAEILTVSGMAHFRNSSGYHYALDKTRGMEDELCLNAIWERNVARPPLQFCWCQSSVPIG